MPLPAPVLDPPFNTVRLSHTALDVTDLDAAEAFHVGMLGLQVTAKTGDTLCLRGLEERGHHCLVLRRADAPGCGALAFKVWSEDDLDRAADWFAGQGLPVAWVERPHQGRTLAVADPQGVPLEFYRRMERLPHVHQRYGLYRGVRPLRIDHFNCFSPDVDGAVAFWGAMGFRVTEYTRGRRDGAALGGLDAPQGRACTTSPSPTGAGRGCTTWRSGCRRRWPSSTCST